MRPRARKAEEKLRKTYTVCSFQYSGVFAALLLVFLRVFLLFAACVFLFGFVWFSLFLLFFLFFPRYLASSLYIKEHKNRHCFFIRGPNPWLTILLLPGFWACNIVLSEENSIGVTRFY